MSGEEKKKGNWMPASVATGAVAAVFLIIGFQAAVFVHKAAVTALIAGRDHPDTVYVIDRAMAEKILSGIHAIRNQGAPVSDEGRDKVSAGTAVADLLEVNGVTADSANVYVRRNSSHSQEAEELYRENVPGKTENFRFNPNTVSKEDLERLGFTSRQAQSIVNYRMKGGRFHRSSDFARSFVVADSVYRRLEKYIDIPLVDLNLADSAAFDALPGIGGYFASQMVMYRRRLGGSFSYKEQLMDIWRFDREKFDAMSDLVTVDPGHVREYPLWTLPEDSLRQHPYIGKYSAHGVVVFRENNPVSAWTIEGLQESGILRPGMAEKLAGCRIAPPPAD